MAGFALQRDMAAGLLGKAIDHRQPQAGALANGLGGEERVEGLGQDQRTHAGAIVADANHDIVASLDRLQGVDITAVEATVSRFDQQRTAFGHRIAGIDHQVEQGAFQLSGVRVHRPDILAEPDLQLDMGAFGATEQLFQRLHQLVRIDALAVQRLPTGESQQAMGQGCRTLGGVDRSIGKTSDLGTAPCGDIALHQVETADDTGEHIVEIVSDTAGQLADRFHFLSMAQGIFGALALEHFVLQALVRLGQRLGALGHALFEGLVEIAQRLFGLFTLGFVADEDIETVDRTVLTIAWQVAHRRVPPASVAVQVVDAETAGLARQRVGDVLGALGIGVLTEHFEQGLAIEFLGGLAEPVEVSAVVQAKALLVVDIADQRRYGIDHQLQFGLALA